MQLNDQQITNSVRAFYERNPYPGLGDRLMMDGARRLSPYFEGPGKILYPGCGTGHGMVAMAMLRPDLDVYGMDLSQPSLDVAGQLADKYGVAVEIKQGNYMQPLPWSFKFRYMSLEGTLHHTADPSAALVNLVGHLEDDGLIYVNLYGKRYHKRRFEIIEMLDLLQQGHSDLQQRFGLFKSMGDKQSARSLKATVLDFSLRSVWRWFYGTYSGLKARALKQSRSVAYTAKFTELNQLWIDQYSNPNEKLHDVWETKELLESAGLELVEMLSAGRVRMKDLPRHWLPFFDRLDPWSQHRVMELYYPTIGSINLLARKGSPS